MAKVKFTKSPTGTFMLAYSEGQVADLSAEMAKKVIEAGYAVPVDTRAEKVETPERNVEMPQLEVRKGRPAKKDK